MQMECRAEKSVVEICWVVAEEKVLLVVPCVGRSFHVQGRRLRTCGLQATGGRRCSAFARFVGQRTGSHVAVLEG